MHFLWNMRTQLPGRRYLSGRYSVQHRRGHLHFLRFLRWQLPGRRYLRGLSLIHIFLIAGFPLTQCSLYLYEETLLCRRLLPGTVRVPVVYGLRYFAVTLQMLASSKPSFQKAPPARSCSVSTFSFSSMEKASSCQSWYVTPSWVYSP